MDSFIHLLYNFRCSARVITGKFKCWFHYVIIMIYTSDYALKLTGWWFNNIEFQLDCTEMYSVQTLATEHGLRITITCSCLLVPLCRNQRVATETTKLWKFWEKKTFCTASDLAFSLTIRFNTKTQEMEVNFQGLKPTNGWMLWMFSSRSRKQNPLLVRYYM